MELEQRNSYHTIRKVLGAAQRDGFGWPLPENTRLFFDLIDRRYNKEGSCNIQWRGLPE